MAPDRTRQTRRRFLQGSAALAGLSLVSGCGVLPSSWQQTAKVARIGFLHSFTRTGVDAFVAVFQEGLRDLGYVEGQNLTVEYRFAEGNIERLPELAAELVRLAVDIIVVGTTPAIEAAKNASGTIPIVIVSSGDPVDAGLIASFGRPGGNVTGVSSMAVELSGKQLQLLKEAVPGVTRVAAIWNTTDAGMNAQYGKTVNAARTLGIELLPLGVRTADDLDRAFEDAGSRRVDAIVLMPDPVIVGAVNRTRLVDLSSKSRLPTISGDPSFAATGGLMSYGSERSGLWRRVPYFVDKILKGAKPSDLPFEQPTSFDFVINLKTAQALGLTIPPSLLMQASEVIQ